MRQTLLQTLFRSFVLLLAAGVQIYSNNWGLLFRRRIEQLLFEPATFRIAVVEAVLGMISGMLILISLLPRPAQMTWPNAPRAVIATSVLLPTTALTIKGIAAITGFGLFPMSLTQVWDWAIFSQTPSLWLGIVLAALVYRSRQQ